MRHAKHIAEDKPMADKKVPQEVPNHVIESFARCLLPAIRKYFDSKEGQREFAEWKNIKEGGILEKNLEK